MAIGDFDPNDPLSVVQGMQGGQTAAQALKRRLGAQSQFPAVDQMADPTAFAKNAPVNTPAQNNINVVNATQDPSGYQSGSMGHNIGGTLGQSYQNPFAQMFNQLVNQGAGQQQQPTVTGYKWNAGTGGVSGGNNDWTRQYMSNGTMQSFTGGVQDNQPLPATQYAAPLLNGERSPFSDPSVGALKDAQRSTNIYGQQIVNPSGGGQIISGIGPTVGFLGNARSLNKDTGQQLINTPSGGTITSGPSRGGTTQNNNQYPDIWRGGWLSGGRY